MSLNELFFDKEVKAVEDYKKPLIIRKFDFVSFKRFLIGSEYKIALTFTLIGFEGEIFGLSVATYDPSSYPQSENVFLLPINTYPINAAIVKAKKNVSAFTPQSYSNHHLLVKLLETSWYGKLKDHIWKKFCAKTKGPRPSLIKILKCSSGGVGSLDNYKELGLY